MSAKIVILFVALLVQLSVANPTKKSNYIEQENSCREVCGLCDCDGFYCEDECICECNIADDDNLQCIADMKQECDKNGLEYELLLQDTAKERFNRDIKISPLSFMDFAKDFVKKRASEPVVAAAAPDSKVDDEDKPEEAIVAAPVPEEIEDPKVAAAPEEKNEHEDSKVGAPIAAKKASIGGAFAIAGLTAPKLLISLKERFEAAPKLALPTPQNLGLPSLGSIITTTQSTSKLRDAIRALSPAQPAPSRAGSSSPFSLIAQPLHLQ